MTDPGYYPKTAEEVVAFPTFDFRTERRGIVYWERDFCFAAQDKNGDMYYAIQTDKGEWRKEPVR